MALSQEVDRDIFVVVKVHSGIPVIVEAFQKETDAEKLANDLSYDINLDYDEVEIFKTKLKGDL